MICVGDKKAKLYHGDYGPAQVYKGDTKIAGYTDTEKVGTSISGVDTYNDQLNPTIEGKSEQTVTANSPSPAYPSPIRSSENFDVVSCGRNLFDKTNFVQVVDNEKPIVYNPNLDLLTTYGLSGEYNSNFLALPNLPSGITVSGTVVGCAHRMSVLVSTNNWKTYKLLKENSGTSVGGRETIVIPYQAGYAVALVLLSFKSYSSNNGYIDFQIEDGAVATPYQPYHGTTAHISDPLRSVANVFDSIEVSEGKVEVVRRCKELPIQDWTRQFKVYDFCGFQVLSTRASDALTTLDGFPLVLCTHGKALIASELVSAGYNGFSTYGEGGYILARIDPTTYGCTMTSTDSELATGFSAWYANHKVHIFHLLHTPTRTDITATPLGQAMLSLRTVAGHTQVFTNAAVPPVLRVKIKEIL